MGLAASLLCVFVAVIFTKIRALDLGASINPFSGNKQFVIRIVERLPSLEEGADERLATYRDAEGQDFSCLMPAFVTEGDAHVDQQALLQSAEDLLGKIGGDCVRQKEGWWVFEVCVGFQVRQYHTVRTFGLCAHFNATNTSVREQVDDYMNDCRRTVFWMRSSSWACSTPQSRTTR